MLEFSELRQSNKVPSKTQLYSYTFQIMFLANLVSFFSGNSE